MDALDAPDALDTADVPDALNAPNAADTSDALDAADALDASAASYAMDAADGMDASGNLKILRLIRFIHMLIRFIHTHIYIYIYIYIYLYQPAADKRDWGEGWWWTFLPKCNDCKSAAFQLSV